MHADVADENATLRARLALLEARDASRTQIEDLYAKLLDSGILDLDEEEEEGMGNGVEGGETGTGAEEDGNADMASDPVSEAEEHDEAREEDGHGSALCGRVNGKVSVGQPTAGTECAG